MTINTPEAFKEAYEGLGFDAKWKDLDDILDRTDVAIKQYVYCALVTCNKYTGIDMRQEFLMNTLKMDEDRKRFEKDPLYIPIK